jgi:SOS response regulatory protein OraA/RecX
MAEYKIDTYQKVFFKILNFVSYKPRTEKEISDRLKRYLNVERISGEEKEELNEKILTQLKDDKYIDDKKTAKLYLESYLGSQKPRSINRFKQALKKKGFKEVDISDLTFAIPADHEENRALAEAKKRLSRLRNDTKFIRKAKLTNFLYSKGYSANTIKSVVDTLLSLQ